MMQERERKENLNPNCRSKLDCQAKGDGLCHSCRSSLNGRKTAENPENGRRASERLKAKFKDPEFAARHREWVRKNAKTLNANPLTQLLARRRMKKISTDPEVKAKMRATVIRRLKEEPEILKQYQERSQANFRSEAANEKRRRTLIANGTYLSEQECHLLLQQLKNRSIRIEDIAKDFLISRAHVTVIGKRMGFLRPPDFYCAHDKETRRKVVSLYRNPEYSIREIAIEFKIAAKTIKKLAKEKGFERPPGFYAPSKKEILNAAS